MRTAGTFGWCLAFAAWPVFAQPALQFTAIRALASNQVELVWSSDVSRLFAIERTSDPGDWDNALCVAIPEPSAQTASKRWTGVMDTSPAFFRLLASPPLDPLVVCHTNLGAPTNDTQIVIGTTNRDYVMQFGNGGEDTQYASTGDGNDWIAQLGGTGTDSQNAVGGTGGDFIFQQGGEGNDTLYANDGDGSDWIIQLGGDGEDSLHVLDGAGDEHIWQNGGDGDDDLKVDAGSGDEEIVMQGGDGDDWVRVGSGWGDDQITCDTSRGLDNASIDGGADTDTLTVIENDLRLVIQLGDGTVLYSNGPPGTLITVTNVEFISVVGTNGLTNWSWTAP